MPRNCDVAVESDSSIQGEQRFQGVRWAQVEIKTRILSGAEDWEAIVPRMLEVVRYCGGRITASCGHYHFAAFELWGSFNRIRGSSAASGISFTVSIRFNIPDWLVRPRGVHSNLTAARCRPGIQRFWHGANSAQNHSERC